MQFFKNLMARVKGKKPGPHPSVHTPGVPGSKRYYEYFVDPVTGDKFSWKARAYLPSGVVESFGTESSELKARASAQKWGQSQIHGG